jgi:hypothetical protein
MLDPIIDYMRTTIEAMPYFTEVYGLTELRSDKGQLRPVHYVGGKYKRVRFNQFGLAYFRKRSSVSISEEVARTSCQIRYEFDAPLRLFAVTKRKDFPANDALAADRFAATLIRTLSFTNPVNLRTLVRAERISSKASLYTTDAEQLIQEELSGIEKASFNYDDLVVAIDIDLQVITYNECLIDPCEYVPRF